MLSVPSVGITGPKTPDSDHYFVRDLVLRLQIGQTNPDGSPLNRQAQLLPQSSVAAAAPGLCALRPHRSTSAPASAT